MVTEAPYIGGNGGNKRGRCVDSNGSGDVASLPLASGGTEHNLRFRKYRFRDDIGNTGDLSDIECGTPILMDDFFEVYSRNGGPGGGGGLCSVAPGQALFSPIAAWIGSLALLALAVRRQRSAA